MKTQWIATLGVIGLLGAVGQAEASTGYVSGKLQFYQNQGGYCPSTRDCTGARYLQSEFNTYQPIRDAKVWVRRTSDFAVIGQGTTDRTGSFTIRWNDPTSSGSVAADLYWTGEHKDGRFALRNSTGLVFRMSTPDFLLANGTTATAPTSIGNYKWGQSGSPHPLSNVYDGAFRDWDVFETANRMVNHFTGVEIRAFSDRCSTSCAEGKVVTLDPNSAYVPQARVMHELGHVASTVASHDQTRSLPPNTIYCFDDTVNCGWGLNSREWQAAAFEEGLATFFGDVGLYTKAATAPHTCYASAAACSTGTFNMETSSRSSCQSGENRWALSTNRYLWDAYDTPSDYTGENLSAAYYEFFDTVNALHNGTWEDQKEEYWNADYSALDDKDGRSAHDFLDVWRQWGTDSGTQYDGNCSPVGD